MNALTLTNADTRSTLLRLRYHTITAFILCAIPVLVSLPFVLF